MVSIMKTNKRERLLRNSHGIRLISFLLLQGFYLTTVLRIDAADQPQGSSATSQQSGSSEVVGTPWTGLPGITESVADIQARQAQVNLAPKPLVGLMRARLRAAAPLAAPSVTELRVASSSGGNVPKTAPAPRIAQTTGVNFQASSSSSGPWPPDTMGDVGPSQILVCLNNQFVSFNKNGVADGALNVTPNNFFTSVGGTTYGTSDPRVRYDRLSQRWFITIITVNTPNYVLIAVSSGPQVTSTSSFTFYRFQHDLVGTTPNPDTGGFADYDTLGVDANALYIGANIFNAAGTIWLGSTGYVVNKANLLAGTLTVTAFRQMGTGSVSGPSAPQGVHNDDPAATEGYFIGRDSRYYSELSVRRITNPGGTPSISANMTVTVSPTVASLGGVPCLGSTSPLDDVDDRLFCANMHNGRLWTVHNIQVNSSGAASSSGGRDGARWYELKNMTTTPVTNQSGTVFSSASSNPTNYFIPTIAVSGQGHALLSCTVAGANEHAEIAVTSRLATDTTGTMQTPVVLVTSSSTYNVGLQNGAYRWGDYSRVTVDPNDDMTFWTFQEYCSASNTYAVRVIQLRAPLPATPVSCSPSSVLQGASNVSIVVTGTQTSGSGFFDPGVNYSNHISAAINGSGAVVNRVTYSSPTSITINLTVAGSAAVGSRTITVTNPDAQTATSATGILTISALPTSVVSGSGTICNGSSKTIQAVLTGTQPWTLTWSDGVVQSGVTASPATRSVNPTSTTNYTVTALSDANGSAQPSDMTGSALVAADARPTSVVSGSAAICNGGSTAIAAALTGTGPWNVIWSDGTNQNGVVASPATRNVSPSATTTYTVTNLTDANCTAQAADRTGSAVVTVNARPTSVVNGSAAICNDGSTTIAAVLTGTGPWNVSWSDGANQNGVVASPATRNVSPSATTTYTVTNLTDANCTAQATDRTGSALVTADARPTSVVSGSAAICNDVSTTIAAVLTGTGPWNVSWSDGTNQNGVVASPATRNVSPSATTTYTVTNLTDANCTAQAADRTGSAVVTVNPLPTPYIVTGGGVYCAGSAGVLVGLSNSQINATYYLNLGGVDTGTPVAGTGSAISFGNQTNAGTYTVAATNATTSCRSDMIGNAIVTVGTTLPSITWYMTNVLVSADTNCQAWMPDITGTNYILVVDDCSSVTVTQSVTTNVVLSLGTNEVVLGAFDAAGNVAYCTNYVLVVDTTPPVLTCATNKTVECGNVWSFDPPAAFDTCSGTNVTVSLIGTNAIVLSPCQTLWEGRWQATDYYRNSSVCTQLVMVVDTTPPLLTCASNKTVQCGSVWSFDPPAASDACGGTNVTVTLVGVVTNGTCPAVYTATWVAVDTCGNTNTCSQIVTTAPPISLTFGRAEWLPHVGVRLTLLGNATGSVAIQWTGEVTNTLSNWPTLIWFNNFSGSTQYIDSDATNFGTRFYRAVTP